MWQVVSVLRLPFISLYWYSTVLHRFSSPKFPISSLPWLKPLLAFESSPSCITSKVFFMPHFSDSVVYAQYFVANIVKSSEHSTSTTLLVSPSRKQFYICLEPLWFRKQSDLHEIFTTVLKLVSATFLVQIRYKYDMIRLKTQKLFDFDQDLNFYKYAAISIRLNIV